MTTTAGSTFEHIFNLLNDSQTYYLVLVDDEGNYAHFNEYFLEKYQAYYKNPGTRSALAALHPDDHGVAYQTNMMCRQHPHQSFQVTLRKLNGRGGYTITQWDFKANLTLEGNISGIIGMGYDITDFESRQDHIKFLTSTLRDVAYKQSHVIRRPLANIMGLVEILEDSEMDEGVKVVVQMLKQSCVELSEEFNSFLIKGSQEKPLGYEEVE
ncbi:hypothetical protein [Mucilaginibacter sp. PAMB04168]|uniref:hypothetical protein n=1 Tax=Mucilaginibacter sp. PAMB04168 TaxID=3138567 RepID=UPI0031F65D4F